MASSVSSPYGGGWDNDFDASAPGGRAPSSSGSTSTYRPPNPVAPRLNAAFQPSFLQHPGAQSSPAAHASSSGGRVNIVDNSNGARASGRSAKGGIKIAGTAANKTAPAGVVSREERERQKEQVQSHKDAKGKGKAREPEVIEIDESDDEDAGPARKKEGHEEEIESWDEQPRLPGNSKSGRATENPQSRGRSRSDSQSRGNGPGGSASSAQKVVPPGIVKERMAEFKKKGNTTYDAPPMPDDSVDDMQFLGINTAKQSKQSQVARMQSERSAGASSAAEGGKGKSAKGKKPFAITSAVGLPLKLVDAGLSSAIPAELVVAPGNPTADVARFKFTFQRHNNGRLAM